MILPSPIEIITAPPEAPLYLDAGWFEVRTRSGRFLGMHLRLADVTAWLHRQPLGEVYRLIHVGPCMAPGCGHLAPVMRAWVAPMPAGKISSVAVDRFGA